MKAETIDELNDALFSAEDMCFITRDWGLQVEALTRASDLYHRCEQMRLEAIQLQDEDDANIALGFGLVAQALVAELRMYLDLKRGEPDEAWSMLIMSQMAISAAIRAHPAFQNCEVRAERLILCENVLFPTQRFLSAGLTVGGARCSICKEDYGVCDHIAGRAYWGELCSMMVFDIKPNHVAVVKEPADKRCRVVKIVEGKSVRNVMTSRAEESDEDFPNAIDVGIEEEEPRILKVIGIIMTLCP